MAENELPQEVQESVEPETVDDETDTDVESEDGE